MGSELTHSPWVEESPTPPTDYRRLSLGTHRHVILIGDSPARYTLSTHAYDVVSGEWKMRDWVRLESPISDYATLCVISPTHILLLANRAYTINTDALPGDYPQPVDIGADETV
ncbi:hypothetical protein KIPB_010867 [Kipferlia bialata]|uniref:Uncharacterized protein n=1 Tax=Kipferlia bialata TaxID=797122 RepID=A0A391NPV0_9EUKA|nr:hypothetical protein KIPB_010867 [Kipferlia bialata]|eukprot:g10867.t1